MKNKKLHAIGVYCGSNYGNNKIYAAITKQLALEFVRQDITLIYGGASVGLMKIIADEVLSQGGKVVGVIPESLVHVEIAHKGLTELHVVNSMPERKQLIMNFSDGFIMLPGGVGSLDEFFEAVTLGQLGYHVKPCGILNINGYFNDLMNFLDRAVSQEFLKKENKNMILIEETPLDLLTKMKSYDAIWVEKWINKKLIYPR